MLNRYGITVSHMTIMTISIYTLENTEGTINNWTIQNNWQHWTNDEDKHNKTHTTIRKQTQIT